MTLSCYVIFKKFDIVLAHSQFIFSWSAWNWLVRDYTLHTLLSWYNFALPPPHCLLPLSARTNRQAGSSAGVLDYCEEPARGSLPPRGGDSCFSFRLTPQTWSGSAYQFSLAWPWQKPHVRTPAYHVSLHYSQSPRWAGGVHLQGVCSVWSIWNSQIMGEDTALCVLHFRRKHTEAGNNWSAFNLAAVFTRGWTLTVAALI